MKKKYFWWLTNNYSVVEMILDKYPNNQIIVDGDRKQFKIAVWCHNGILGKAERFLFEPILTLFNMVANKVDKDQMWV